MEPTTTLILAALAFGAREVASEAIKDSYSALKCAIEAATDSGCFELIRSGGYQVT